MKKLLTILIFSVFALCKCTNEAKQRQLLIKKKITHLSDSSFFSDIRNIDFNNGTYLVSDYKRGQLLELDTALNLKKVYGSLGDGRGETKGVSRFYTFEDTIYVISQVKKAIECFKRGVSSSVKTIDIPQEIIGTRFDFRFFINKENIVLSAPQSGKIVSVLNRNGKQKKNFGELRKFQLPLTSDAFETTTRNINWLFLTEDANIIALGDVVPELQIMGFEGKIKGGRALYEIPIIKERNEYISKQPFAEHVTYAFFRDIYFIDNHLYLLCISGKEKKSLRSNRIIILEFINGKFNFKEEVELPGKWYSSICITNNSILAFENTTGELQLIKL